MKSKEKNTASFSGEKAGKILELDKYTRFADKMNEVYKSNPILPWQDLPLPERVLEELIHLETSTKLLFTGCGFGQHPNQAYSLGFKDVTCTDISEFAIKKVRKEYPYLKSYCIPTQILSKRFEGGFVTFDLHNLHQVPANEVRPYLESLQSISIKLYLSWVYEPERGSKVKSDVHGVGLVYHHNPEKIQKILKEMTLVKSFDYYLINNPKFFKTKPTRTNRVTCQIYQQSRF
jgi:SAM-dependent methyltransferase